MSSVSRWANMYSFCTVSAETRINEDNGEKKSQLIIYTTPLIGRIYVFIVIESVNDERPSNRSAPRLSDQQSLNEHDGGPDHYYR